MLGPTPPEVPLSGGFLATALGPMLDPLELLRLAGVPESGIRALLALRGRFEGELCREREEVGRPEVVPDDSGDDFGRNGTFLTVLVETALLREERDERRDVRELLRSTSSWCWSLAVGLEEAAASGDSDFRIEFVRRGNRFLLTREGGVPLSDLLRSNADWLVFLVMRMLGRADPALRTGSCLLGLLSTDLTTFLVLLLLFFESDP